jgi:hypothetical protein
MAYAFPSAGALDYALCNYGASQLLFRGPKRDIERVFISVLGGSDCFGRFVKYPFPDLIEKELGLPVANFGLQNAGPDVYLNDAWVLDMAAKAAVKVVQIFGAQNISNRYYTVHPRRNDRFLAARPELRALYPDMDFTEFHFTRHLLHALHHASPNSFAKVAQGLREDWVHHMRALLGRMGPQTLLLWVAGAMPPPASAPIDLFVDQMLIDSAMIGSISALASGVVYAIPSPEARAAGLEGMIFDPTELTIAANLPGPYVHRDICTALLPHIEERLSTKARAG